MGDKPWLYDYDEPTGLLTSQYIPEYKRIFEEIHGEVSNAEWSDIVSDFNLENNEDTKQFVEKPNTATQGDWWTLQARPSNTALTVYTAVDFFTTEEGVTDLFIIDSWKHERYYIDLFENGRQGYDSLAKLVKITNSFFESLRQIQNDFFAEFEPVGDLSQSFEIYQKLENNITTFFTKLSYNEIKELLIDQIDQWVLDFFSSFRIEDSGQERNQLFETKKEASYNLLVNGGSTGQGVAGQAEKYLGWIDVATARMEQLQTKEDFKDSYTKAIIQLGNQKVLDEYTEDELTNLFKEVADLTPVGEAAIAYGLLEEGRDTDLEAIREKIRKSIEQEVKEAFADNLLFSEQCFMLTNLDKILEHRKRQNLGFPFPYYSQNSKNPDLCGISKSALVSNLNQPLLMQGEPFSFMNKMAVEPDQQFLFDIMPHEISSLTPNIELYKVISEEVEGEMVEYEIPIKFDINTKSPKIGDVYRSQRGTGVGVKSFGFSYDGTDPFSAKKAISADLSIFASSFSSLIEIRDQDGNSGLTETNASTYRYTDLALKTGTSKTSSDESQEDSLTKDEREQLDKLNFRLKVVVQWAAAPDMIRGIKREEIKKALYNSAITMYLTPVIHTFDFDDNGGVTFNISYKAYIEDFFTNENFNIFSDLTAVRQLRNYLIDYFKDQDCDLLGGEEFKLFQKADSRFIINKNRQALSTIIGGLHDRQAINYLNMTYEEIEQWMLNPYEFEQKALPIGDGTDAVAAEKVVEEATNSYIASEDKDGRKDIGDLRLSLVANSQENQSIAFFYLSDLVSVVMNLMEQDFKVFDDMDILNQKYLTGIAQNLTTLNLTDFKAKVRKELKKKKYTNIEQFKKMRIVLGPMEIRKEENSLLCSVGDIPISLNYFTEFLVDKVVAKDLANYPISKFIKDIINQLVRDFLNSEDCAGSNTSQRMSINSTTIVGYNNLENGTDTITELATQSGENKIIEKGVILLDRIPQQSFPLVKISADRNNPNTSKSINMMTNFYVFSVGRSYPTEKYIGDKNIDASSGIFHYLLGEDKGIVKSIKLQKTNTPGLKEVRFEQEGYEGLEQLREVYNASIECYLNPQTFPGTYIYIPPEGFSPDSYLRHLVDNKGQPIDLTKFGIGGYYMITGTKHSISPGEGTTTLEASWVASKDGSYGKRDPKIKKRGDGEGNEKVKKCKIAARGNTNNRQ